MAAYFHPEKSLCTKTSADGIVHRSYIHVIEKNPRMKLELQMKKYPKMYGQEQAAIARRKRTKKTEGE